MFRRKSYPQRTNCHLIYFSVNDRNNVMDIPVCVCFKCAFSMCSWFSTRLLGQRVVCSQPGRFVALAPAVAGGGARKHPHWLKRTVLFQELSFHWLERTVFVSGTFFSPLPLNPAGMLSRCPAICRGLKYSPLIRLNVVFRIYSLCFFRGRA